MLRAVRVHKVVDGDTIQVKRSEEGYDPDGEEHDTIRLAGIDAPEIGQPYGAESAAELNAILFDAVNRLRPLLLDGTQRDKYGRTLGRFYIDLGQAGMIDVNGELVSRGAAWVYRRFDFPANYAALEHQARVRGAGLWSFLGGPLVAPWDWRQRVKEARRRRR